VNHAEALQALEKGNADQRHRAARTLVTTATPADREALSRALLGERVPRIRVLLQDTLRAVSDPRPEEENRPQVAARESAALAVEDTAKKVVHQVGRLLTFLADAAETETPNYAASRTHTIIQRMDRLIRAIERLGNAASAPALTEFDLTALISEVIAAESDRTNVEVVHAGDLSPLLVIGDQGHIDHALTSGVRNAIEASLAVSQESPPRVIVNAGETDSDYWVVVLDRGIGLPPASQNAKEFGVSTKVGHDGTGLAIADLAIDTLGGDLTLSPREGGGVQFEVFWPKPEVGQA
jgi:signal transduction histidine kinase